METATDYKKYAILYVDDEEQALKYFRRGLDREFQIVTVPSVAQAFEILQKDSGKFAVILTDQRMPVQFGVELLKRARQDWPNIVRILTTAYSDVDSAIESVNSGAIYKYLTKPVDLQLMKETLRGAIDLFVGQNERESLMQEKLSSLQRFAVADRVRSMAALADGISHHLRNSMTAMTCFLEEATAAKAGSTTPEQPADANATYLRELWALAQSERDGLLRMIQSVGDAVVSPECHPTDEQDMEPLIRRCLEPAAIPPCGAGPAPAKIVLKIEPGAIKLKVDADKMARLFKTLVGHVARLGKRDCTVTVAAEANVPLWNTTGARILVTGEGPAWSERDIASLFTPFAFPSKDPSELGLNLLMAFNIAYQHGGDIIVRGAGATEPGFEVLLPSDPAAVRRPELGGQFRQTILPALGEQRPITPAA